MAELKCPKCSCENYVLKTDSRGIPEARCAACSAYIKKMSTREVIEYYEEELEKARKGAPNKKEALVSEDCEERTVERPLCRYCTEDYFLRFGRLGMSYQHVEAKYCPMCGRKLLPSDRDYR